MFGLILCALSVGAPVDGDGVKALIEDPKVQAECRGMVKKYTGRAPGLFILAYADAGGIKGWSVDKKNKIMALTKCNVITIDATYLAFYANATEKRNKGVVTAQDLVKAILTHEMVHVMQWERLGLKAGQTLDDYKMVVEKRDGNGVAISNIVTFFMEGEAYLVQNQAYWILPDVDKATPSGKELYWAMHEIKRLGHDWLFDTLGKDFNKGFAMTKEDDGHE